MSDKEISKLMKKVANFKKKKKVYEALEVLDKVLEISPEFLEALEIKTQILYKLTRYEESFQPAFKANQIKLQKEGIVPSDINSPDAWLKEATNLINYEKYEKALTCLLQASFISPIVNREGLENMTFHTNAQIYYFTAVTHFGMGIEYDTAMSLFELASKLDPTLTIPNKEKQLYKDYKSNRSGEGLILDIPLDESNLQFLVPCKDKILLSTKSTAHVIIEDIKTKKTYSWRTHLLLTDYGIAFSGALPFCKLPTYYVPLSFAGYAPKLYPELLLVLKEAGDFKHNIRFHIGPRKQKYLEEINIYSLIKQKIDEQRTKIINTLQSLENLPSYKEYISRYENVRKVLYKDVVKSIKQERKASAK